MIRRPVLPASTGAPPAMGGAACGGDALVPDSASAPVRVLESVLAYRLGWYESVLDERIPVEGATSRVRDLLAANPEDR